MRVLIFRHVPFEGAGRIEPLLRARGIPFDYADLYRPDCEVPEATGYAGLIFMGGPISANDDLAYLRHEEQIIRDAVAARVPLLGICLGAQLIARALGGTVRPNPEKEIGWFELRFTATAAGDLLFDGLTRETVFHWHGETFDLPPRAELLASSDLCRNQAFRVADRTYGLQFHLEVTPEMIGDWCRQDENCGDVRELTEPIDANFNTARLTVLSDRIFGQWCELLYGLG